MPSTSAVARRSSRYGRQLLCAALLVGWNGVAQAQETRPPAAVLLDRLCAETLRPNEEDRLFGVISITVDGQAQLVSPGEPRPACAAEAAGRRWKER